jgi:molybdopterin-guanine dinucleotide biosynthesis protein A
MNSASQFGAFILAGGASSRMEKDKGLLEISGIPLIVRTAALLEPIAAKVTVVGDLKKYANLGIEVIPDVQFCEVRGENRPLGPLSGIATALAASRSPWNIVLACDLPYMTGAWLERLISRPIAGGTQALVPRTSRGLEPLTAIYHRDCLPPIAAALSRGVRKVTEIFEFLRTEIVLEAEWREIDPTGNVLRNMNTPDDYQAAVQWYAGLAANNSQSR